MFTKSLTITTTGSAGVAVGSGKIVLEGDGELVAVALDYHASAPATTDVTIKDGFDTTGGLIFTRSNSATDLLRTAVVKQAIDTAGAAVTTEYRHPPVSPVLFVEVAQCDALTGALIITVWIN